MTESLEWFQPVLDFANLGIPGEMQPNDGQKLADCLRGTEPIEIWPDREKERRLWLLSLKKISWEEAGEPLAQQRRLRAMLDSLHAASAKKKLQSDLYKLVGMQDIGGHLLFATDTQQVEIIVTIEPPKLSDWYGFAVAELLSEERRFLIGRCALPSCQKYFVGSPRKKFCSKNHGSQARVKRKRIRDRVSGAVKEHSLTA